MQTVAASKLVIVSCGTLGTPFVLEGPGVGDPDVLEAAMLIVARVTGVDRSFQDY
jgi:choline dehydrogenase-like flavoprotein